MRSCAWPACCEQTVRPEGFGVRESIKEWGAQRGERDLNLEAAGHSTLSKPPEGICIRQCAEPHVLRGCMSSCDDSHLLTPTPTCHLSPLSSHLPGHEVHVVTISSKGQLLVSAVSGGRPTCSLSALSGSPPSLRGLPQVVTWRDEEAGVTGRREEEAGRRVQPLQGEGEEGACPHPGERGEGACPHQGGSLHYHVVLGEGPPSAGEGEGKERGGSWRDDVQAGVLHTIDWLMRGRAGYPPDVREGAVKGASPCGCGTCVQDGRDSATCSSAATLCDHTSAWVIIDADDSQQIPPPAGGSAHEAPTPCCLFAAVAGRWRGRCLALVQNVHFLPFGPSGTGLRAPELLKVGPHFREALHVIHTISGSGLRSCSRWVHTCL